MSYHKDVSLMTEAELRKEVLSSRNLARISVLEVMEWRDRFYTLMESLDQARQDDRNRWNGKTKE